MSREQQIAVVEAFLDCMVSGDLERLPVSAELTVESPLTPELGGDAAMEYVKAVAAGTKAIRIVQHIVEGDHVATLSENTTGSGPLWVFAKFQLESGLIRAVRVFYDARAVADAS